jgi:hypothetical protein
MGVWKNEHVRTPLVRPHWRTRCIVTWRDIESAPKDGTHVVAWLGDVHRVAVICWTLMGNRERWYEPGMGGCTPTHWMPLPAPPEVTP